MDKPAPFSLLAQLLLLVQLRLKRLMGLLGLLGPSPARAADGIITVLDCCSH